MSLIGLDAGTSQVKAVRFDARWRAVDAESEETMVSGSGDGAREQDMDDVGPRLHACWRRSSHAPRTGWTWLRSPPRAMAAGSSTATHVRSDRHCCGTTTGPQPWSTAGSRTGRSSRRSGSAGPSVPPAGRTLAALAARAPPWTDSGGLACC